MSVHILSNSITIVVVQRVLEFHLGQPENTRSRIYNIVAILLPAMNDFEESTSKIRRGEIDPRDIPIPVPVTMRNAADYRNVPISKPLCSASLVNLLRNGFSGVSYYNSESIHNPIYKTNFSDAPKGVLARKPAVESLRQVNKILARFSAKLFVMDGFRNLSTQHGIRDAFIRRLQLENPQFTTQKVENEADKYYSRAPCQVVIDNPTTWYAHSTGGALDVTLVSESGAPLEFGAMFDGIGTRIATAHFENHTLTDPTDIAAQRNRRLLFWAMSASTDGIWINYPQEFFHFDFFSPNFRTQFGIQNAKSYGIYIDEKRSSANVGPAQIDGRPISSTNIDVLGGRA